MLGDFFIWCSGSDKSTLSKCSDSERIKQIGIGTLVLIPCVLAFISMSYALSTIDLIKHSPRLYFGGGIIWGLIIFSFDRYVVSTHRRKERNIEEFHSPAFFLRISFAIILGVVVSHPIVMLYFDGSITDEIKENIEFEKKSIDSSYSARIEIIKKEIHFNDSITEEKEKERNNQELIVEEEIDGEVLLNTEGKPRTTGIKGKGTSAQNKIDHLQILQTELDQIKNYNQTSNTILYGQIKLLNHQKDSSVFAYTQSFDYLKRELALEELKTKHNIIAITQWFLMLIFILVDLIPVVFKTFSPFGMYDKILLEDSKLIKDLDTSSRKEVLQSAYNEISNVYADSKQLNKDTEFYKKQFSLLTSSINFQRLIFTGVISAMIISFVLIKTNGEDNSFELTAVSSLVISIIANSIHEGIFKNNSLKN